MEDDAFKQRHEEAVYVPGSLQTSCVASKSVMLYRKRAMNRAQNKQLAPSDIHCGIDLSHQLATSPRMKTAYLPSETYLNGSAPHP